VVNPIQSWRCLLELNSSRQIVRGSPDDLGAAIGRAADLRIGTEFLHNEHIDVTSSSSERIREVAEFGVTYRINNSWSAGVMSLRQPIELPTGFGPRPSMSFFLYNQDGTQGIARPFLDGRPAVGQRGAAIAEAPADMPKYHVENAWDAETNAPSHNFVYDFDVFRFCVRDDWQQVLHHSSDGTVLSGSLEDLIEAFSAGCSIKLGIKGLCDSLTNAEDKSVDHEVFVQGGSAYYYMEQKLFMIGSHPVVRIRPAVPMRYSSDAWDFGWLMIRTDGHTVYRRCDPHTLQFTDHVSQHGIRWLVR
jgi:hypothetical protein